MQYKIAEIKVDTQYFYVIVGSNNANKNWHVLCGSDKLGVGFKLKKLYDDWFITRSGDLTLNENVKLSKTYTYEELVKNIYVSYANCICFYGCSTGGLILQSGTRFVGVPGNEFFYTFDAKNNFFSVLRIKDNKEDGPFEIKKRKLSIFNR